MQIEKSHIIVTGGSLGIGRETARLLVEKGAKVVITGRDQGRLTSAAEEIGAVPLVYDLSKVSEVGSSSFDNRAEELLKILDGRVDALINNAGHGEMAPLGELTLEHFQRIFSVNVYGLALLTQRIAEVMKKQLSGSIVNLGSTAAQKGFPNGSVYAASKFAVRAMTQCWQTELRKYNIRVSLVNPSSVITAFNNPNRIERAEEDNKLRAVDIAETITNLLEQDDRGFIPEVTVWATNPF